jgi:hypothetical protein
MSDDAPTLWDVMEAVQEHPSGAADRTFLSDKLGAVGFETAVAEAVKRGFLADHDTEIRITAEGATALDSQLFG